MILDLLRRHSLYQIFGDDIARGFAWLDQFSPKMSDGQYEINGSQLFALVQSYDAAPSTEKKYESHHNYIDIQYVAAGSEIIYYAPTDSLQPVTDYHADKDYQLYADPAVATPLYLPAGSFALFYPRDGHKPGCLSGASSRIKKVVIKVRV